MAPLVKTLECGQWPGIERVQELQGSGNIPPRAPAMIAANVEGVAKMPIATAKPAQASKPIRAKSRRNAEESRTLFRAPGATDIDLSG
jgi:hypothetical protein